MSISEYGNERYDRTVERGVHDRGGSPTDTPIDRTEHALAGWELTMDAIVGALGHEDVMNVDELRRGIESMPREEYEAATYYERWLFATETILGEKGVLAPGELDERVAHELRARSAGSCLRSRARGAPPDPVAMYKESAGRSSAACEVPNPGDPRIRRRWRAAAAAVPRPFRAGDLWRDYDGAEEDCLLVDLFEHWLAEDA